MSGARLQVDVSVPDRDVRARLEPAPGRITAIIGPNGAGKSTVLGAVSGLVPAQGSVRCDDRELLALPAHRRRAVLLQQRPALFAHLTVERNVAFGPRAHGIRGGQARAQAQAVLERLALRHLAQRRPATLSGGQAQKVALARALAVAPDALLLDEPLAALDAEAASSVRAVLAAELAGRTTLLVTHDLLDVLALADDVAVMEAGRVIGHGSREQMLRRPPTAFAAHLVGRIRVPGTFRDGGVQAGTLHVQGVPDEGLRDGAPAVALIDPAQVRLVASEGSAIGSERATAVERPVEVPVESIGRSGSRVLLQGGGVGVLIDPASPATPMPRLGEPMRLLLDPHSTPIYADEHGSSPRSEPAR